MSTNKPTNKPQHDSADEARAVNVVAATPVLSQDQIEQFRAWMDTDALQVLRDAETQPLDYATSYESPTDPTLVVEFSVRSYRLYPREALPARPRSRNVIDRR